MRGRGGRGRGGASGASAADAAAGVPPLPRRVGLAHASEEMLKAKPELSLFHGLNVSGKYIPRYSSYSTYGNMGSTQVERVKTHFADMVVPEGTPAKMVCTILISANSKGYGAPFRLCGHEIARGEGGSNMARHVAAFHPEHVPPEDCLAKGLHPITRLPIESAPAASSPPAVSRSKIARYSRSMIIDRDSHTAGFDGA